MPMLWFRFKEILPAFTGVSKSAWLKVFVSGESTTGFRIGEVLQSELLLLLPLPLISSMASNHSRLFALRSSDLLNHVLNETLPLFRGCSTCGLGFFVARNGKHELEVRGIDPCSPSPNLKESMLVVPSLARLPLRESCEDATWDVFLRGGFLASKCM